MGEAGAGRVSGLRRSLNVHTWHAYHPQARVDTVGNVVGCLAFEFMYMEDMQNRTPSLNTNSMPILLDSCKQAAT